ncbi:hypothetical protein [Pseudomonas sp. LS-2]|uniref:hypothetical protein n=1 Tax=Pseudomonas sp. LS-2 TaxID=2315859 RepID=UPI000E76578F|nr:hypothetical protein [Pseudomonas sp. LS-2]RJX82560.1 hypothetical protein D3M70_04920 [Pseudomonas sp. LS-2]
MADQQPDAQKLQQGMDVEQIVRRRKVMLGVGVLLAIVVVCVTAIGIMLHRLEARNAAFQPPMTALERQRMLPPDPVLDAAPSTDGLRYGRPADVSLDNYTTVDPQPSPVPLKGYLMLKGNNLQGDDLRAHVHQGVVHQGVVPASQTR